MSRGSLERLYQTMSWARRRVLSSSGGFLCLKNSVYVCMCEIKKRQATCALFCAFYSAVLTVCCHTYYILFVSTDLKKKKLLCKSDCTFFTCFCFLLCFLFCCDVGVKSEVSQSQSKLYPRSSQAARTDFHPASVTGTSRCGK